MNKIECKVCGFEFTPTKEGHYIARANEKNTIFVAEHTEGALYDAWDCPMCGTQYSVPGRMRQLKDDTKNGHGCNGCTYEDYDEDDYPCVVCKQRYFDKYEQKMGVENGDK